MRRAPSSALLACIVLVIAGGAIAGGALQTIDATLHGATVQAPPSPSEGWERPATAVGGSLPRSDPAPMRGNLLFDPEHLQAARHALETMPDLSGQRLTVFHSIHFHDDGRISLDLVDPWQPGCVNTYRYANGEWHKGERVDPHRFAPTITLRRSSTALANIDFDAVPRVAQALQQQRAAWMRTPSDVDHVQVVVKKGGRLQWLPDEVTGDRGSARLSFDSNGNLQ